MRKGTPEQVALKREEIVDACEQLYQTMSFREITLKEISKITSFSRPTIYNYFETKEEIFLALFKREYDRWNEALTAILEENGWLTKAQLADRIAQSLADREQLLKLLSMNNYDMEAIKAALHEQFRYGGQQPSGTPDILQAVLRPLYAAYVHAAGEKLPGHERGGHSKLYLYLLSLYVRHLSLYSSHGEAEDCHEGSRRGLCVQNRL